MISVVNSSLPCINQGSFFRISVCDIWTTRNAVVIRDKIFLLSDKYGIAHHTKDCNEPTCKGPWYENNFFDDFVLEDLHGQCPTWRSFRSKAKDGVFPLATTRTLVDENGEYIYAYAEKGEIFTPQEGPTDESPADRKLNEMFLFRFCVDTLTWEVVGDDPTEPVGMKLFEGWTKGERMSEEEDVETNLAKTVTPRRLGAEKPSPRINYNIVWLEGFQKIAIFGGVGDKCLVKRRKTGDWWIKKPDNWLCRCIWCQKSESELRVEDGSCSPLLSASDVPELMKLTILKCASDPLNLRQSEIESFYTMATESIKWQAGQDLSLLSLHNDPRNTKSYHDLHIMDLRPSVQTKCLLALRDGELTDGPPPSAPSSTPSRAWQAALDVLAGSGTHMDERTLQLTNQAQLLPPSDPDQRLLMRDGVVKEWILTFRFLKAMGYDDGRLHHRRVATMAILNSHFNAHFMTRWIASMNRICQYIHSSQNPHLSLFLPDQYPTFDSFYKDVDDHV